MRRIGRVGFARICVAGGGGVRGAGLLLDESGSCLGGFRVRSEAGGVEGYVMGLCEGVLSRFGRGG